MCPFSVWPSASEGKSTHCPSLSANRNADGDLTLSRYIRSFVSHLETYKKKNGQMAIDELNKVAHSHAVILAPATDPDIKRWGTEIQSDGIFRIVFTQDNIGINTSNAAEDIIGTVQKAAKAGGATSVLNLTAKASIQNKWDAKVNELTEDFKKILATPVFTLSPNFETNAQALADFDKANPKKLRGDELDRIGEWVFGYFDGAKGQLKRFKFDSDDMLQEGFKEVVDKNELSLRVVPALKKGPNAYNEAVIEEGVMVMQTTPPTFLSNVDDVLQYVESLL